MPVNDPTNIAKPLWNADISNNSDSEPNITANANEVFVINDVVLEIPPTAISIQNEDLVWQWKTLRTKSSTKIPSGRGMCQVTLNVVFTPTLLLHLHRLVVQFNHSPFCWIENRLLRESLAPHWPAFKNMAFTMTGLHINNLPGHPGSFNVQIDLRWFNYAPYGANYLFRRDWRTRPITDTDDTDFEKTISRFITKSEGPGGDTIATPQEIQFRVPSTSESIAQWSPIKQNLQIHSGFTLQQLKENHLGEVFDLLPLPSRMKRSYAVGNPAQSNIYVRYINNMQQKHLLDNFNIDVHWDLTQPDVDDVSPGDPDHVWEKVTVGELNGNGLVRGLHTGTVPQRVRSNWIERMLIHGKQTSLVWTEYMSLDLGMEINQRILDYYKKLSSGERINSANNAASNLNRPIFEAPSSTTTTAWPVVNNAGEAGSGFGRRFHPVHKKYSFHKGVDIGIPSNTEVKAILDGEIYSFGHQTRVNPETGETETWGGGGILKIKHSEDFMTVYMHLNKFDMLPVGTAVSAGDEVGLSGGGASDPYRGTSTGPHLHFEVRIRNSDGVWESVEPTAWLNKVQELHLPPSLAYSVPNPTPTSPVSTETEVAEEEIDLEEAVRDDVEALFPPDGQVLTDDQLDQYVAVVVEMLKQGYTVYEGDNTIKNVFKRVQQISINCLNSDELNWDPLNTERNGVFTQHDAVVTSIAGSLGHIIASIPIIGHEYPTHQHLGSIEPTYGIEFTCIDPSLEGLSTTGQMLQGCRNLLQENARKVRLVPGSSCLSVDSFMTRFLGSHRDTDIIYNGETGDVDHLPRAIISRSSTQTIEGSPGTTAIYWDIQETNPYQEEYITPYNEFGEQSDHNDDIYKEILQALDRAGTSDALDNYGSKQLLLGLGDQVVGLDALSTIDPNAAAYFEGIGTGEDGARTFLVYRQDTTVLGRARFTTGELESTNLELHHAQTTGDGIERPAGTYYRTLDDNEAIATEENTYNRYEAWAEQNGILYKKVDGGDLGAAGLNLQDVTDLSMQLFESGSYQGFENITGYGTDEFGGAFANEEDEARYTAEVAAMREQQRQEMMDAIRNRTSGQSGGTKSVKFSVVETTNFTNLSPSQETENRVQNYSRMLEYIKITADLIICEEEVNEGSYASGPMAFPASDVRADLYDLDINPSMYGAYVYGVSQEFWKQAWGVLGLAGVDQYWDFLYAIHPWLKIDDNPSLQRWINSRAYYGVLSFVGDGVDLITTGIGTLWRVTGLATASRWVAGLLELDPGGSTYDYNESILYNQWAAMHDAYFDTHGNYMNSVFPLQGGVWQQNVVEEYFAGFDSKLGVQYGDGSIEGIAIQQGEERFGISTFLGGLGNWFSSLNFGMKNHNDSPSYNPITSESRAQVYKEYYFAAAARSAGIELENLDKMTPGGDPMYLWDSPLEIPFENSHPPFFTTLTHEKIKIKHIKGLLKGLAQLVRGYPDVMEVLGIQYAPQGIGDTGSNSSGIECYPDLDLPDHPYYGNALYAMNPDFYYWNIYDDATGTLQEDILSRAEEAVQHAVEGPYNALKSMQQDGMDPSEYADAYGYIDVGDSTLVPDITTLIHHPEASDDVDMGWYPNDRSGRVWISTGASHQPIAATNVFVEGTNELSPEYRQYLNYGKQGLEALKVHVDRAKANASGGQVEQEAIQKAYDELVFYNETQQVFPPLLSNWHGNQLYRPTGETLEYYKELNSKVRGIETFFGSRLGYVGGLSNSDSDEADGLTDTRLASLAAYKMTFDQDALKKLAVDSAKDILSQKYTMRRAFPTFKLFFVEEDQIYNRVLSFDDFHAFNGVKEFTVHQSRKNPADTATIVLQNVSGTLDGTKRGAITDLDYYKQDESGNYEDPLEERMTADQTATNSSSGDDALTDDADRATSTTPSWVDSQSQPFGSVILRPGLNVQLRVGYSNDPSMLNVLISGRVTDVQWSTNGDLVEIVVQSFGTELVKYLKGRGDYGYGAGDDDNREIYPTTHQLLSSLMLSPELKHFGRWTNSGIFQHGEAKDASVDFTDYEGKSMFSNFKTTNAVLNWMYNHPVITTLGYTGAAIALHTPWGRGIGAVGRGLYGIAGRRLAANRFVTAAGAGIAGAAANATTRASRFIGTKFLSRRMSRVLGADGVLGHTRTAFSNISTLTPLQQQIAASSALSRIAQSGAFNGVVGRLYAVRYGAATNKIIQASAAGDAAALNAAIQSAVRIETAAVYSHATLLQLGIGSTSANVMSLSGKALVGRSIAGAAGFAFIGVPLTVAKLAAVTMIGLGGADLAFSSLGDMLYNSTIGWYKRRYALTKARLFLSPQDDNLYPPAPKDYMHFDYTSFWSDPGEWAWAIGKKAVFGLGTNLLYAGGVVSKGGVWAEDNTLNNWYDIWSGGKQPEHVLEKRVMPAQCHYHCDNVTIWDVFHEMTLRHPGWVYGARPYGTRFRYTMFFGVPSQRYWSKPASNTFIHRINKLRDYINVGVTEDSYKLLYGQNSVDRLRDELKNKLITVDVDDPDTYFEVDSGTSTDRYETYEEAETAAGSSASIEMFNSDDESLGIVADIEAADLVIFGGGLDDRPGDLTLNQQVSSLGLSNVEPYRYNQATELVTAAQNNPGAKVVLFSKSAEQAAAVSVHLANPDRIYIIEPYNDSGATQASVAAAVSAGMPESNVMVGPDASRGLGIVSSPTSTASGLDHWEALGSASQVYSLNQFEDTQQTDNPYGRITGEVTLGSEHVPSERFEEELRMVMTNRVLEEYLLGLENRFVPFRRYHYITSDADIVHNGIISSNKKVANAVSVLYQTPESTPEDSSPGGVVDMKASARIPEEDIQIAPVHYKNCKGYTMGLRYGLGSLLYNMKEMYNGELLVLGNPRIRPWDICILRDEYNDMVGPVEVEAVVHMFSHETGYLTEIKPNAVVIANEISSYPVLSALQLMCMAVEDNSRAKGDMDTGLSDEEEEAYRHGAWSEDMKARYSSVFGEDGFSLDELFPGYGQTDMEQIMSGVGGGTLESLNEWKDFGADLVAGLGVATTAFAGYKGWYPRSKLGILGGVVAGSLAVGGGIAAHQTVKSTSLQWFLAAPILFAQCLEEETVTIVPLTKNGIPIVSGLSMRDPAMMWRAIFGNLYNYAQDTAIGLQDMAWYWDMAGDGWWENWVQFSSDEGFSAYRQDFANAAGG